MKTHFCPEERTMLTFVGECNWCGEKEMTKDEAIHKALKVLNCLNNDRVYETAWVKGAINACEEALEQPLTRDWKDTIDERIARDSEFKEALEQPAQEPVAWVSESTMDAIEYWKKKTPDDCMEMFCSFYKDDEFNIPLYTHQRKSDKLRRFNSED